MERSVGPKKHYSYNTLLLISCAVCFSCYFGSYMRIPVVPIFAGTLGADTFDVGLINSAFLFMAGALSIPFGLLSDFIGRKLLILLGLTLSALCSFLLCLSTSPLHVGLVYVLFGIGLAAFAPTMMSFVADFSPATHLGRTYGWYTMALYSGMSGGPAAGGFFTQWLGFKYTFFSSGVFVSLVTIFAFLFLPRARTVLVNRPRKGPAAEIARELIRNRGVLACWLVTLGGCFGLGMFVTFIPLHASGQGISVGGIGLIYATQALVNALSRLPFGQLSDRIDRRSDLVLTGFFGFSFTMAFFGLVSGLVGFLCCAVALGIFMGIAFTALGALITEIVPARCRGLAMGGYNTCIYLGMMLSSVIMGASVKRIGFNNAFFVTSLLMLAITAAFYLVFRNVRTGENAFQGLVREKS